MVIYSTLVAMAAVGTSPMPVFFALVIFYQPEVVLRVRVNMTLMSACMKFV